MEKKSGVQRTDPRCRIMAEVLLRLSREKGFREFHEAMRVCFDEVDVRAGPAPYLRPA